MSDIKVFISKAILFAFMLFICLNLTKEHWQNFNNYDRPITFYEKFEEYLNYELYQFDSGKYNWERNFIDTPGAELEQREKTRWVFLSFINQAMYLISDSSNNFTSYPSEKISLFLYSIFIGIILFSIFLLLFYILLNIEEQLNKHVKKDNSLYILIFSSFSFMFLTYLIFFSHYRGGEDNFSIFETFFMMWAIYCVIKGGVKNIFIYVIICMITPLVRESGIFLSGFYWLFNYIKNKKLFSWMLLLPFVALVPYIFSNYDLFQYFLVDGFIYSTKPMEAQTTWHNLFSSQFIGTLNAIFYNFIIFFVPIFIFYVKKSKLQLYFLLLIALYFLALTFGSVLDHISTRFMPGMLIIIYSYIGIRKLEY